MTIQEYTDFRLAEVLELYASVGWTNYTRNPQLLISAYKHSLFSAAAFEDDRLVGMIRVVGDGASIVFVQDLLVMPEYRRRGIGTKLLDYVIRRYNDVYRMELFADDKPKSVEFYESRGFMKAEEAGMHAFLKK